MTFGQCWVDLVITSRFHWAPTFLAFSRCAIDVFLIKTNISFDHLCPIAFVSVYFKRPVKLDVRSQFNTDRFFIIVIIIIPRHILVAGYYVFTLAVRVSVRPFVRPFVVRTSVHPHFVSVR